MRNTYQIYLISDSTGGVEPTKLSGPLLVGVCAENLPPPYFTDKFCTTTHKIFPYDYLLCDYLKFGE